MTNFLERFKARSVPELILDLTVGPVTFKAHRFSEEEKKGARKAMRANLKEEGFDPDRNLPDLKEGEVETDPEMKRERGARNVAFALALADIIKRHIKGWDVDDSFSTEALDVMWSEMTDVDRVELAGAYLSAEAEALKKSAEESHRNSLNGASAGSNTKSESPAQTAAAV